MALAKRFTPELIAYVRPRYEDGDVPVPVLARELGVSCSNFYTVIERLGWRLRKNRPPRGLDDLQRLLIEAAAATPESARRAPASLTPTSTETPANPTVVPPAVPAAAAVAPNTMAIEPGSLLDRLQRAVAQELDMAEEGRARLGGEPRSPTDAERSARSLATLAQLMRDLQQLRPSSQHGKGIAYDDMPADDDEFRRDLARRIDAFIAASTDPALGEFGAAGDGDPAWP